MIKRLVVWGGTRGLESHRHIHKAYHHTARKIGIDSVWVDDQPENESEITPGSTVLAIDIWSRNLPFVEDVNYVLHNFDASHPVCRLALPTSLLRLQVWTNDAFGEEWDVCRQYDKAGRILFQPWGTDLLAEEFMEPVFNQVSREVVFVGAIWGEKSDQGEMGNMTMADELRQACRQHGLTFKHLTQVSDQENVSVVRGARLAPAFTGSWQEQKNYLPCRMFKNISYGALGISNVPKLKELFGESAVGPMEDVLSWALTAKQRDYLGYVSSQQRVASRYTYRQNLEAISRALEE